jgi:peptide/nickel transport system permease protein
MWLFGRKKTAAALEAAQNSGNAPQASQDYWSIVKRQFSKNRLAVWSLRFFYVILFVGIFADFLANEKPLYCKINGETHFPVMRQYLVDLGLASWDEKFILKRWSEHEYESVIFPPITYSPTTIDKKNMNYISPLAEQKIGKYMRGHYLGTDALGRDVASGMIHGTRTAMLVGIVSMSIATLIGILLGSLAGYFGDDRLKVSRIRIILNILALFVAFFFAFIVRGYSLADGINSSGLLVESGKTLGIFGLIFGVANLLVIPLKKIGFLGKRVLISLDLLIMRFIEIVNSIPVLILILSIVAIIKKPSLMYVMIIIGAVSWTSIAMFIRSELLRVRRLEYIEAAQAFGYSEWRIILRHAIPNALTSVLITIAFGVASAILTESFLSFIGVGVPAEQVTWGSLLSESRDKFDAWWLAIFPGLAIFFTVTIFNLIGEGLSDALDPRSK